MPNRNELPTDAPPDELARVLGPTSALCIVVGAIIGVGIFFNPSQVAEIAGSRGVALGAWALGGAIAMLGALTFAELGGLCPRTGGQYHVLRAAYGPLAAFVYVFCNTTAIQAGAAAVIATICAQNVAVAAGVTLDDPAVAVGLAAVLIVALSVANVVGVRWGSAIQNATVFVKLATLLAIALLAALAAPDAVPATAGIPAAAGGDIAEAVAGPAVEPRGAGLITVLCAALVPAFFAFGGWQHALWMAGEVRRPARNVPLSIIGGVAVVVAAYLIVNWAYFALLGYEGVAAGGALAADAVGVVWPEAGRRFVAGAVAVSAFGVLNAQFLSGPRLVHGMASDGRFFAVFARVSPRFGTPSAAIALVGAMSLVLLGAAAVVGHVVDTLVTGVVFIDGIFFALTGFALIVLRRTQPAAPRPVRVPLYPIVPILFVVGEAGIVAGSFFNGDRRMSVYFGLGWIVLAVAMYLACFRDRKNR